jgi:hypothetical protein
MKYDNNIREEELKNRVREDFFSEFNCARIIGSIDFAVKIKRPADYMLPDEDEYLLWAEAKKKEQDDYIMLAQLILTIGKARTFEKLLPPPFLGCFDCNRITFIPYSDIQDIFYQNDFNWNVTPSNKDTKEFKLVYDRVKSILETKNSVSSCIFYFEEDEKILREFIHKNFILGKVGSTKIQIDKNNFITVYNRWLDLVKPTIKIKDWELVKTQENIIDVDFYLADLLSLDNETLGGELFVLLKTEHYELDRKLTGSGLLNFIHVSFTDNQKAHKQFWDRYERPPTEVYQKQIKYRRDLLVPQDIRERKGSFFTPKIWVELSQRYLTEYLGVDWQEKYIVWDCAAGTGNLLAGLTNKDNLWASTLHRQDVAVMHDRIENGANLWKDQVFEFDFLNDNFTPKSQGGKMPDKLYKIIKDEEKRKELVIYINPPYAEASNKKTLKGGKEGNRGVEQSLVNERYAKLLGQGNAELFVQFLTRIYCEIPAAVIANFSTLKIISGQHFIGFRNFFCAKLEKAFVCPANTFDNVKGEFPIGFFIWNTSKQEYLDRIIADVYDKEGQYIGTKSYYAYDDSHYINEWIKPFRGKKAEACIGKFPFKGNDFQNQNIIAIVHPEMDYNVEAGQFLITANNLIEASIYFAVRKVIPANWLNDRDQFLYPNDGWRADLLFQSNCLTYALFKNNIRSVYGENHWIPFTEKELGLKHRFASRFMTDFISGKIKKSTNGDHTEGDLSFSGDTDSTKEDRAPLEFSLEAKAVFDAGRELWRYYHKQPGINVNASLYDIREHFQGRNDAGRMNSTSNDAEYNLLLFELREKLKLLASKIEPKVYEYGFLKV